jgi:NAD(P)-dependent dehydrogenase (short-subunit alcohol dehydrogenase family)
MSLLAGKVAIITGAGSGIGRAAALLFAKEGAKLVLNGRREHEIAAAAEAIRAQGGDAVHHAGSVAEEATAEALVALALDRYARLDIGFNNAGVVGENAPSTSATAAGFAETLSINLTGAFLGAKHQIPAMLKGGGGSVIFTSTVLGSGFSFPGMAGYAASKAGLRGLTQTLAAEFGPQGVRVNALLPGAVETPMAAGFTATNEARSYMSGLHALKRIADASELARAALYLASDLSSFMTGQSMLVDGGASITRS